MCVDLVLLCFLSLLQTLFLQVVESHKLQWRAESKVTNDDEDLKMDDDNEDDNENDDRDDDEDGDEDDDEDDDRDDDRDEDDDEDDVL